MGPLIELTTVPIEIEMKTTNARLEYARGTAEMEISTEKGGLSIRSRPIRVNLDTFEARSSIRPTAIQSVEQAADKGKQAVYDAMATYARQGKMMMQTKVGQDVMSQIAAESMDLVEDVPVNMEFIPEMGDVPSVGVDLSWEGGEMNIRYEMDKLNFDWRMQQMNFEFVPGDIEISVKQLPDLLIKYVGDPLYVPPSSNPNYVPTDVRA